MYWQTIESVLRLRAVMQVSALTKKRTALCPFRDFVENRTTVDFPVEALLTDRNDSVGNVHRRRFAVFNTIPQVKYKLSA